MTVFNLEPQQILIENNNEVLSSFNADVYDQNNPPSKELVQKMVEFDKLCFDGPGQTTSEKYSPGSMTAQDINDGINHKNRFFIVQNDSGDISAVTQTFVKGKGEQEKEQHIMSVAISPKYRGIGLSDALLEEIYYDAREKGLDKISLRVDPLNLPAIKKYIREGFIFQGGRSINLDEQHQNVVTLAGSKRLNSQPEFSEGTDIAVSLENFSKIDELAQRGYAGVDIENANLIMKKLSDDSCRSFLPWR